MQVSAASVLIQLGNEISELEPTLLSLLKDSKPRVRSTATIALGKLAKTSDTVLPEVLQWLEQNQDNNVMGIMIDCLYSIVVE